MAPPVPLFSMETVQTSTAARQPQLIQSVVWGGMPFRPREPFVSGVRFVMRMRMISAKPSVAMPR